MRHYAMSARFELALCDHKNNDVGSCTIYVQTGTDAGSCVIRLFVFKTKTTQYLSHLQVQNLCETIVNIRTVCMSTVCVEVRQMSS